MKQKPEMTQEQEEDLRKNPIHLFRCGECKEANEMEFKEFKEHLLSVHTLKADQLKGKKQMVLHMDGAQWYSSTYEWTLEVGLKFTEFFQKARAKDDPMRHEY